VHLSKETLYIFANAAASQEIDVEPRFALDIHVVFYQRLHSIKLSTLHKLYIRHAKQTQQNFNMCEEIDEA